MYDDSTRKWFRAARRHAIIESIGLNALVTTVVFMVSSQYDEILKALSRVNLHVPATRQSVILAMVVTVVLPAILFVVAMVGRIARNRLKILEVVAKEVRHTDAELLQSMRARAASRIKAEVAE